ncbi:hypothetical protein [Clostridium senegalense]|uniref:Uncharacterized protein n=1 Tax=Clostridium senegalense TaxID=1465809 RepID=A0A6M0H3L4_9CLOT|nr:hypothetical protein [Clostridium senegalense]NEU04451.1 hypothetical protein [Clostridium senegalense]
MRISGTLNSILNSMGPMEKGKNNFSNKPVSALEKQKMKLEEQMKKIEESKSSKEIKDKSIRELKEKLEEIEKQLMEEKTIKLNEKPEIKKAEDKEGKERKIEEENYETSHVINKDVMKGLISASSHGKIGETAYSVYKEATVKGDMGTAQRALKYTMVEVKESSKSKNLIAKGIKEYNKQMDNINKDDTIEIVSDNDIIENS